MKIYNYILTVVFIQLLFCVPSYTQTATPAYPAENDFRVQNKEYEFSVRTLDKNKLNSYKSNPDFDYERKSESSMTFFEKIIEWIKDKIRTLFYDEEYATVSDVIMYSLMGIALLIIISGIFKTETRNIFAKNTPASSIYYDESEENIHELNFDELIAQTLRNQNYRLALRLTYLKLLKDLDSANIIKWRGDKTNHELIIQIKQQQISTPAKELTRKFENIWYGGIEINEDGYASYRNAYNNLAETLKSEA